MNKGLLVLLIIIIIIASSIFILLKNKKSESIKDISPTPLKNESFTKPDSPTFEVLTKNLEVPWALAFLPNGDLLVTERIGRLKLLPKSNFANPIDLGSIEGVVQQGEGGLHGITVHPEFEKNNFIYLYFTYLANGNDTFNRVVRYKLIDNKLEGQEIIVDKIPGALFHDGGRIKFGPDKYLYITTGDAQEPSLAQDKNSLAGKILRVADEGKAASGNPFNTLIYSYGHRNPQGIAWDSTGQLWETEHGQSATDEVNKIEYGKNYGWPVIRGDQAKEGMVTPLMHSGDETWAPSGAAFVKLSDGSELLFFAGLRGKSLFELNFKDGSTLFRRHFKNQFGRIREVILGPDNLLYITTSNKDGRGNPSSDDDRIIRVNPEKL